jgi:hypothetical protein
LSTVRTEIFAVLLLIAASWLAYHLNNHRDDHTDDDVIADTDPAAEDWDSARDWVR